MARKNSLYFNGTGDSTSAAAAKDPADQDHLALDHVALDSIPDLFFIYDSERRFKFVNAAVEHATGLPASSFIGKLDEEVLPAEIVNTYLPELLEVYRTGKTREFEQTLTVPQGFQVSRVTRFVPVLDENGHVQQVLGVAHDITMRKAAETALRREREMLRNVLDANPGFTFVKDWDGRFVLANLAVANAYGTSVDEIIGKTDADFNPDKEQVEHFLQDDREVITKRQPKLILEEPVRQSTGEVRWYSTVKVPLLDEEGKCRQLLGVSTDITEHRNSVQALRENEDLLRKVVEAMPVGVWILDGSGQIVHFNSEASRIWGGGLKVGIERFQEFKAWWASNGQRLKSEDWGASRAFLKGETSFNEELLIEGFDGSRKVIFNSCVPLRNPSGDIAGAIAINEDITQRKQAEQALRENEERLRLAMEMAELGVWEFDHATGLNMLDRRGREIFGIADEGPLPGDRIFSLIHPEDRERLRQIKHIAVAPDDRPVGETEFRIIRTDGTTRWITMKWQVFRRQEADREPTVRFLGTIRDLTQQKNDQIALQESKERFRSMAETVPDILFTNRPDGWCDYVNPLHYEITGQPVEQALGFGWMSMIHPDDVERAKLEFNRAFKDGRPYSKEFRMRTADGSYHWFAARARPIRDRQGRIEKWFGACVDVNDMKMAQESLERFSQELQRSNMDLEQFAYVASHDLQEPLRMVTSFLQLLSSRYSDKLDSTADEYINFAFGGARRMQQLIDDLLIYSRLGTRGSEMVPTDVNDAVSNAMANLRVMIDQAQAQVIIEKLPVVNGDISQLTQLFQNLIGNALKFHSERRPEIKIGAQRQDDGWLLWVSDNGIGIDPQYHERVFMIFQRLHPRQTYEGTGIGLAICKKIVERHRGRIWVNSTPGRGSTFYFTIRD